jgi:hypothetical protein
LRIIEPYIPPDTEEPIIALLRNKESVNRIREALSIVTQIFREEFTDARGSSPEEGAERG